MSKKENEIITQMEKEVAKTKLNSEAKRHLITLVKDFFDFNGDGHITLIDVGLLLSSLGVGVLSNFLEKIISAKM